MKRRQRSPFRTALTAAFILIMMQCVQGHDGGDNEQANITFDQALSNLYAEGYPQNLMKYFCSLGTNPDLGFRLAGTPAEHAAGMRIEEEMQKMGLRRVRREPVPVDVTEFKNASVTIGSRKMIASAYGGVPPTPKAGISAQVVYVKGGMAADFDDVGDVTDKLVVIDLPTSVGWHAAPAFEAQYRKAIGIILARDLEKPFNFSNNDRTLGAYCGTYNLNAPPFIYVGQKDGAWIKSQIQTGVTEATLVLDQEVTLAEDGGVAYNVLGELPGTSHDGQVIVLLAHQDAHFRSAIDNTSGLVNMLTIGKAMAISNFQPDHTIVFLATAAEEYGRANTDYDPIYGSYWAACREHKEWVGRTRALINLEFQGAPGSGQLIDCDYELEPWLRGLVGSNKEHFPRGIRLRSPSSRASDHWPFSASGIPVFVVSNDSDEYRSQILHTNYDTYDLVDWGTLKHIALFTTRVVGDIDKGLLPYNLREIGGSLLLGINREQLTRVGADPSVSRALFASLETFNGLSDTYLTRRASIASEDYPLANERLLAIVNGLKDGLTTLLSTFHDHEEHTYPHTETLQRALGLQSALAELERDKPNVVEALKVLKTVGKTDLGLKFSYPVYRKVLQRQHPASTRLFMGELGKLPMPLDIIPEYRALENGKLFKAVHGLEAKFKQDLIQLNRRLRDMTFVLQDVNNMMEGLIELCEDSN